MSAAGSAVGSVAAGSAAPGSAVAGSAAAGSVVAGSAAGSAAEAAAVAPSAVAATATAPASLADASGNPDTASAHPSQAGSAAAVSLVSQPAASQVASVAASAAASIVMVDENDDVQTVGPSASQVGADPTPAEPTSEPEPKKKRKKVVRKKKRSGGSEDGRAAMGLGVGGDTSSSVHSPLSDVRYNSPPDASGALTAMQEKVQLPEGVRRELAEKQRRMEARRTITQAYGKHQSGVPKELMGNIEDQNYNSSEPPENPYVGYVANERYNQEYRICPNCGMAQSQSPFCPLTGHRHVPIVTPPSHHSTPYYTPGSPQKCDVVPVHVPVERGAPGAPHATPFVAYETALPAGGRPRASSRLSVADSLPFNTREDATPLTVNELASPSTSPRTGEGAIDWGRVKQLADHYSRLAGPTPVARSVSPVYGVGGVGVGVARAGSPAVHSPVFLSHHDPSTAHRTVSPPRVSPYSPNVGGIIQHYAQEGMGMGASPLRRTML